MAKSSDSINDMLQINILQLLSNKISAMEYRVEQLELATSNAKLTNRLEGGGNTHPLFNMAEASKILRIPKATLYGYTSKGRIAFTKSGRQIFFTREQLDSFLQEHTYRSQKDLMIEANTNLAIRRDRKRLS